MILGNAETFLNHFIDVIVAIIGWFIIIIIWSRSNIPWISSKKDRENILKKWLKCCFDKYDKNDNEQQVAVQLQHQKNKENQNDNQENQEPQTVTV